MFDMTRTGKMICEARKEKGMTQMELADQLNISFQAVSNWERGMSMPDISKLPEISELLGISVDELLGKNSAVVHAALAEDMEAALQSSDITAEELEEAVPLLKPGQLDQIVRESSDKLDLSELDEILPFLGRELCEELFRKCCDADNMEGMELLMPFVSRDRVEDTASAYLRMGKSIEEFAPFMGKQKLEELAEEIYREKGISGLEEIAPFLNRRKLNALAEQAVERNGIRAIAPIAPFLSRDMMAKWVKEKYLR